MSGNRFKNYNERGMKETALRLACPKNQSCSTSRGGVPTTLLPRGEIFGVSRAVLVTQDSTGARTLPVDALGVEASA